MKEVKRASMAVQKKHSVKVQPIRGFNKDIEKYIAQKMNKVIDKMNDKNNEEADYKGSYNYMVEQFMKITIDR